jgi:hypothetical protein
MARLLHTFSFVEHYRKRIEEINHIQKYLLIMFTQEFEKDKG